MWSPQCPDERARLTRIEKQWERRLPALIRSEQRSQSREVRT